MKANVGLLARLPAGATALPHLPHTRATSVAPPADELRSTAKTLAAIETLDPEETKGLLDEGKLLLIDVREPAEFAVERIRGALLYPLSTFDASRVPDDGTRQVVLYCGAGKRSLAAAAKRLAAGNDKAAHMGGGITAWKRAGLPVIALSPETGGPVESR